jgi:hypothetical protein
MRTRKFEGAKMEIIFDGGEADQHRIEAYTGASSLEGVARAAVLTAHFAATGQVRFRAPYSFDLEFYISAPEEGSLGFPLGVLTRIEGAIVRHKRALAVGLLPLVLSRATGQAPNDAVDIDGERIPSGTIDALAEAATPGLAKAHTWIDREEKVIRLTANDRTLVQLDSDSKRYMETEIPGERLNQDVSVAALNANSKIGRVYFYDLGRTVPFKIAREATGRTAANLARYLTQYVDKTGRTVNIEYLPMFYPDERLKRILIFDCYPLDDER